MNIKKDPLLKQFMQQAPCVKPSECFTDGVMRKLPERNPLRNVGFVILSLLWLGFGVWVWTWHETLFRILSYANWNMKGLLGDTFISYFAFLVGLGILLWQTTEFLMKNFSGHKSLTVC